MSPWKNIFHSITNKHHNRKFPSTYNELKIETLEVRTLLAADLLAADTGSDDAYETIASTSFTGSEDTASQLQSLIDSGSIASAPAAGLPTPGDFQGNALQPIVTDSFSQAVPSNDWWSSVHFAEYGDQFSAPLFIHPITVKASETGLSLSAQTIHSAFETGPTLREYQVAYVADLHVDLFGGQSATQFALDSYSDWAFTGKWKGVDASPSVTMAQGSPMVWLEGADLEALQIRWDDGAGSVYLGGIRQSLRSPTARTVSMRQQALRGRFPGKVSRSAVTAAERWPLRCSRVLRPKHWIRFARLQIILFPVPTSATVGARIPTH